jgi:hypothetical protein
MLALYGGRRHKNGKVNGLIWFEATLDMADREDPSKWDDCRFRDNDREGDLDIECQGRRI